MTPLQRMQSSAYNLTLDRVRLEDHWKEKKTVRKLCQETETRNKTNNNKNQLQQQQQQQNTNTTIPSVDTLDFHGDVFIA